MANLDALSVSRDTLLLSTGIQTGPRTSSLSWFHVVRNELDISGRYPHGVIDLKVADLSAHYKNLNQLKLRFYDRFMTIEMKVPSTNFGKNDNAETALSLSVDNDMPSEDDSE